MCLGIPAKIVAIEPRGEMATVDVAGIKRAVNITCVNDDQRNPTALIGAWVLVHVGFAMSIIDESEAKRTLALLDQLGEIDQELDAIQAQFSGEQA